MASVRLGRVNAWFGTRSPTRSELEACKVIHRLEGPQVIRPVCRATAAPSRMVCDRTRRAMVVSREIGL